jgi:PEP-CTERM motif
MSAFVLSAIVGLSQKPARATLIPTVESTGQGLSVGVVDPNFTIVSVPAGATLNPGGATDTIAPISGFYVAPPVGTQWIGPNLSNIQDEPAGNYDFQTTFSLSGFDPTTAQITGTVYADNSVVDIKLNGVSLGISGGSFSVGVPYTIVGGFLSGTNTLDFIVNNAVASGTNPMALLVSQVGSATATSSAVPEPSSLVLASLGGTLLVGYASTRARAKRRV